MLHLAPQSRQILSYKRCLFLLPSNMLSHLTRFSMALWQNEGPSSSFRHLLKIIKITRLLPLAGSKTKRNTYDLLLIVQDGSVPSFFIIEDCLFLFIPTSEASLRINGIKQTRHEFQSHCVILQMELSDLMFHFSCTCCFACTVNFSTSK